MTFDSLRFARPVLAIAVVAFIAAGCSDDDDDDGFVTTTQGNLQVLATDVPPELDRLQNVFVTINRIEAIGPITTGQTPASATLYDAGVSGEQTVDLLPLKGGATELLASSPADPGLYDRVRVFFSNVDVRYDTTGGVQEYSLDNGDLIFGGQQQGGVDFVEFDLPDPGIDLAPGENEQVLLDFDLAQSLDVQGDPADPTTITFTPTGQARVQDAQAGSLLGVVRSDNATAQTTDDVPVDNATVVLRSNGDIVATTLTDASGAYAIEALEPGQYTLIVTDPEDTTRTIETNTTISTSQATTADVLLLTPN